MTPERWQQIEAVYHGALACEAPVRSDYLSNVCAHDSELRREVESLLAHGEQAENFLSAPAIEVGGRRIGPTLEPGSRIGDYQILSALGAGGMGEVYRAQDPHLGRQVAIKMLPQQWFGDAARRARFEREARLLASLNHPHIGAIYGLVEYDGVRGLVLELVEGETLAGRLAAGPLPLGVTIAIASQLADALDTSHEKGIIHRDLKPANIIVRGEWLSSAGPWRRSAAGRPPPPGRPPDVTVKVLDFGLARAGEAADAIEGGGSAVSSGGTRVGAVLGTPAYMSPEQARGKPVDKRTDIWAFGCVLFEMLAGCRAFPGDTASDTTVAILEHDPDWSALPAGTPPHLRRLAQRCLEKEPRQRLRDIGDARLELAALSIDSYAHESAPALAPPSPAASRRRSGVLVASIGVALALAAVLLTGRGLDRFRGAASLRGQPELSPASPPPRVSPTRITFDEGLQTDPAISPDGQFVAYTSNRSGNFDIWVQPVAGGDAVRITSDPAHDWQPHWSPDGSRIVFRSERRGGGLFVVPALGGPEERLSTIGFRPRWSPDGSRVLFDRTDAGRNATTINTVAPGNAPEAHDLSGALPIERGRAWGWASDSRVAFLSSEDGPTFTLRLSLLDLATGTWERADVGSRVQFGFESLGLVVQRAPLAWDPAAGAIYFIGESRGLQDVWRIGVEPRSQRVVSGPDRITASGDSTSAPTLSRDGKVMAFGLSRSDTRIWSFGLTSSGTAIAGPAEALTSPATSAMDPDLSADGSKLVYLRDHPGGSQRLEVRERRMADGRERTLMLVDFANGERRGPVRWSPDGRHLSYRYIPPGPTIAQSPGVSRVFALQSIRLFNVETDEDSQLTSPESVLDFPNAWSDDGEFVLTSGNRYNPERLATLAMVPVARAPHAESDTRVIVRGSDAEDRLYQPGVSPNRRWLCFVQARESGLQIKVVSMDGGRWRSVAPGPALDDKPRWSADGRLLYFVSRRGGLANLWAIRFDAAAGNTVGEPFKMSTRFDGPGEMLPQGQGSYDFDVGGGRLVVPVVKSEGGIWLARDLMR